MSDSLWPHGLYGPWNYPGHNTGVGSLSLLQGIFLIQGSNSGLLNFRWILYQLSYEGSPGQVFWTIKIALKVSVYAHQFFFFPYLYFIPLLSLSRNKLNYLFAFFLLNNSLLDLIWSWAFPGIVVMLSRVRPFATQWTLAHQTSLSTEYSRQEYRNGLSFPTPRDLPN